MRLLPMTTQRPVDQGERSRLRPRAGVTPRDHASREAGVGHRVSRFWRIREEPPRHSRVVLVALSLTLPLSSGSR